MIELDTTDNIRQEAPVSDPVYKAMFVLRTDLPMSGPKRAVQVGHGTDFIHDRKAENPHYDGWREKGNRRKIVCRATSLTALNKVEEACKEAGLLVDQIWDAGYTELGAPTQTGLVIHPVRDDLLPREVTRLQLLKD